jgi:deoxyribodipyrimidine photo-lyase
MTKPSKAPVLVWIRKALRLADNPLWETALAYDAPIIPVFIYNTSPQQVWPLGGASRWWLHHSLENFAASLTQIGSQLVLEASDNPVKLLLAMAEELGAQAILYDQRVEPEQREEEAQLQGNAPKALHCRGLWTNLLLPPGSLFSKTGEPYRVFSPFWKQALAVTTCPELLPAPTHLPAPVAWPESKPLESLKLLPRIPWDSTMRQSWKAGEAEAQRLLYRFCEQAATAYSTQRNLPAEAGTSRLSPYLAWGEISPAQIWHQLESALGEIVRQKGSGAAVFLSEIGWREFAYQLLYFFPHTALEPLQPKFKAFPWKNDPVALKRWQTGQTGYPIVDAGMRELYATGWMHNRVRMIVGSFLVKDLLLPWQDGARWFWDTLVDADLASNSMGWQWVGGCGADAAPYFRVFNPTLQSFKFDPEGAYVRKWVPELAKLHNDVLHEPWKAKPFLLKLEGVQLGETYPEPIVDHHEAKDHALKAFAAIKMVTA